MTFAWLYILAIAEFLMIKMVFRTKPLNLLGEKKRNPVFFFLPLSGTLQQCGSAIDHLKRIIKHKSTSLSQPGAKRRIPRLVFLHVDITSATCGPSESVMLHFVRKCSVIKNVLKIAFKNTSTL